MPASRSLKSLDTPESPDTPDFLLRIVVISSTLLPSLPAMNSRIAGSISPLLVPIGRPARGVSPMEVSTDLPPSTAVILDPFPRWHTISLVSLISLPISSASLLDTKLWLVPWKPYLLIL